MTFCRFENDESGEVFCVRSADLSSLNTLTIAPDAVLVFARLCSGESIRVAKKTTKAEAIKFMEDFVRRIPGESPIWGMLG